MYGKRRLKSAANSELMDTTVEAGGAIKQPSMDNMLMNDARYSVETFGRGYTGTNAYFFSYHRRTKSGGNTLGLNYKFVSRKTGLTVRLTWPDKSPSGRYRLHLCRGTRECLTKPMGANSHDVLVKVSLSCEES